MSCSLLSTTQQQHAHNNTLDHKFVGAGLIARPSTLPFSPSDSNHGSPSAESSSGSSAQYSDEDQEYVIIPSNTSHQQLFEQQSEELYTCSSLLNAPPAFSTVPQIEYGANRLLFLEKLLWTCVAQIHTIWEIPISNPASLQQVVHKGLVHGLCNEIVMLPIMDSPIPFPLFMAEMLRRMRTSCFLLSIAMRYILDIADQVKLAKVRAECGWCRSGISGCDHQAIPMISTNRFSKGRQAAASKKPPPQKSTSTTPAPSNTTAPITNTTSGVKSDPLVDPRKTLLGCLILASKFHRDRSVGNKTWANLIGLPLDDVHTSERSVAQALGWCFSRPWLNEQSPEELGSTHPSYAEPLFATNEEEVARYGVKALRDHGTLPPPQSAQAIFEGREGMEILSGVKFPSDRKILPVPTKANPLRKAATAPGLLEPSSVVQMLPNGKRKASQDLGGRPLVARCGDKGQRIVIESASTPIQSNTPRLWDSPEDMNSLPDLDSDCGTPSVEGLSRTNTPPDLMEIAAQVKSSSSQCLWQTTRAPSNYVFVEPPDIEMLAIHG